jgi:thymidylate kinase
MVATDPITLTMSPCFIYITGCDGTGKTTQAKMLLDLLSTQGIKTDHVWLRFPFLFSIPFLIYARLRGFSWYETNNGIRHGYWDFRSSWLLRTFLPWFLLIDAALTALIKIYLPLWIGRSIICERFVLDMIVDLMVAFADFSFHRRVPGKFFLGLLPPQSKVFLLDLDAHTIIQRRPELETDRNLIDRLKFYRILVGDLSLQVFSSRLPTKQINSLIFEAITG